MRWKNNNRAGGLAIGVCLLFLSACGDVPPYNWDLPPEFPQPPTPQDNPMTLEKVELGRYLFYDRRLSANGNQACADCHQQAHAFSEPRVRAQGSTGESHRRNSLALVNVAYNSSLTWAHAELLVLEQQILIPMFGEEPIELGIAGHEQAVLQRFASDARYAHLFEAAFGDKEVNFDRIVKALACFVRSLLSFGSRFDRYAYYYQDDALNESELRGLSLFMSERLECHHCHGGFNFSQSTSHLDDALLAKPFHNTGLYNIDGQGAYPSHDQGLYELTASLQDMGAFRAPSLRNIVYTAPYMHDGSMSTLEEVIDFYAAGGRDILEGMWKGDGRANPHKNPFVKGFSLTAEEQQDLLSFLHALSDEHFINNPQHSDPFVTQISASHP